MPPDTDDNEFTSDPKFLDAVEKAVSAREAEAARKRDRNKAFKDPGDALERIADAVWDRFEERRNKEREDAEREDEEPARGGKGGGVLGFLSGGSG